MRSSRDEFDLRYGGQIRKVLIEIEGDDRGFELLAHGWLAGTGGDDGTLFALVRSRTTDRVHLLVRDTDHYPRHEHWHRISPEAQRALQDRIVRLRSYVAEPGLARRTDLRVSASEKPKTANGPIGRD